MKKKIKERILKESELMIQTDKTIREIANMLHVSKSTVHYDLKVRLYDLNLVLYYQVRTVLDEHLNTRHIKGGEATRLKYLKR